MVVPVVVLGLATMAVGGWRALAQYDLKRLLAFGTVSQLGFLMVLFGAGTRIAAIAGIAMLLAHGFFKAPLFLVTHRRPRDRHQGRPQALRAVDVPARQRDHRRRGGRVDGRPAAAARLRRLEPEFEAFLAEDDLRGRLVAARAGRRIGVHRGLQRPVPLGRLRPQARRARHPGAPPGPILTWPAGLCAVARLALGIANPVVDADAQSYAGAYPATSPEEAGYHLALWHGFGLPLLASATSHSCSATRCTAGGAGSVGSASFRARCRPSAATGFAVGGTERVATVVTGRLQAGSVPTYLSVILLTVVALPGTAVLVGGSWPDQPVYHAPLQLPLADADDARGARAGPRAQAVHRGAAGRGRRLRRRRAVHRRRRPGPRPGPVPRRDALAGRVRLRAAPDAGPVHASRCRSGSRCPRP